MIQRLHGFVRTAAVLGVLGLFATRASALPLDGEVARILADPIEHDADAAERLERLTGLGGSAAPEAVRLLAGRVSGSPLDGTRRELLIEAVRAWPEEPCTQAILGLLGDEPSLSEGTTVVRLFGLIAGGRGVQPVCAIARSFDGADLSHPRIGTVVEEALAAMLRRDSLGYGFLREELRRSDTPLVACMVAALGQAPSDESAVLLERLLGRSPELDSLVLESFGKLGPWVGHCGEGACALVVRRYLGDHDPKLRRHAAVALGRLEDTTAVPDLVEQLDDPDRRVRGASLWALRRITGLGWSGDPGRWRGLENQERDWLAGVFPDLAADFLHEDATRARGALHDVSTHVLVRHDVAPSIARAFEHQAPSVAIKACETLAQLGGADALRVLEGAFNDPRTEVRDAARRALAALRVQAEDGPAS